MGPTDLSACEIKCCYWGRLILITCLDYSNCQINFSRSCDPLFVVQTLPAELIIIKWLFARSFIDFTIHTHGLSGIPIKSPNNALPALQKGNISQFTVAHQLKAQKPVAQRSARCCYQRIIVFFL